LRKHATKEIIKSEHSTAVKRREKMRTRFETVFVMVVVAGVVLASRGTWGDEGKGTVLRWKVPEGQALGFRTDISPVDPKKEEGVQPDVNRMIEDFLGKDGAEKTPMPDMKGRGAMSTILKAAGGGNIAIQMVLGKLEMPEVDPKQAEEIKKKFAAMEGTVQLRAQTGRKTWWPCCLSCR
jgi:hypothetical protein